MYSLFNSRLVGYIVRLKLAKLQIFCDVGSLTAHRKNKRSLCKIDTYECNLMPLEISCYIYFVHSQ